MVMLWEIMLWLLFGYVMTAAVAAVSARREAVFWPPRQPGENKCACISYRSLHLLPASSLALPTLGSVGTVQTV